MAVVPLRPCGYKTISVWTVKGINARQKDKTDDSVWSRGEIMTDTRQDKTDT